MQGGGADACIWYLRNCVDISQFNPAAPPPMTEFLRDIRDASKTPVQQTIEAFIAGKVGAFQADLITSTDAANTLRTGELVAPNSMYCDGRIFTPGKMGTFLKEIPKCVRLRACRGKDSVRLWAVRDIEKYQTMSMTQVYDAYDEQVQLARSATPLTIVR